MIGDSNPPESNAPAPARSLPAWWIWLLVPVLAILAYLTALRIGFLGDDFVLLVQGDQARASKLTLESFLPEAGVFLYRPVGRILIWQVEAGLWGYNPFPFHLQGLILHAGVALVLGLWLAEATGRRALGWLAGALFAVFPLHTEAVGWLAAQWDVLATLFGLLSLWLFTRWFSASGRWWAYGLSLFFYTLALFTKDSMLTFLPLLPAAAWLAVSGAKRLAARRLALSLAPFVGALALNLGLRYETWGNLGGYPGMRTDYLNFAWDALVGHIRILISPISAAVMGTATQQLVGGVVSLALLLGLTLYGRREWRVLLIAGLWILMAVVPVLNLPVIPHDLQQNRLLYLAAAGYCVAVAALLYNAVQPAMVMSKRSRAIAAGVVGALLFASIAVCWVQLRPWHTATVQAQELEHEMLRLIPPAAAPRPAGMVWYAQDSPRDYRGAYLVHLALGMSRYFLGDKDIAAVRDVPDAEAYPIASDPADAFAMRFDYEESETRFHADFVAGITEGGSPPEGDGLGDHPRVWDFRGCTPSVVTEWRVEGAQASCEEGETEGLVLREVGPGTHLVGPPVHLQTAASGNRFIRLRISTRYPSSPPTVDQPSIALWLWRNGEEPWNEERSQQFGVRQSGRPQVYWTFIRADRAGPLVTSLRLNPADFDTNLAIQWIAVDLIK